MARSGRGASSAAPRMRNAGLTAQVVGRYVGPHFEVIDDQGRQRRSGVEQRAVDDQEAEVPGAQPCTPRWSCSPLVQPRQTQP